MSFIGNFYASLAYALHTQGKIARAEKLYEKGIAKGCTNPTHIGTYGVLLMRSGKAAKALDLYDKAIKLSENTTLKTKLRMNRATCYLLMGDTERALVALEDLDKNYPCTRVYETLGYAYIVAGAFDRAVEYNLKAYDYDDKNSTILDNLTQSYLEKGDYVNAQKYSDLAYAKRDDQVDILYHRALIAEHNGEKELAARLFDEAKDCRIDFLNSVTREKLKEKANEYKAFLRDDDE